MMILVDTSIWVDHLRSGDERLAELLEAQQVLMHPFVIGELALGDLQPREEIISALRDLPRAIVAFDDEVLEFIERQALNMTGLGYVDAHLLAAVILTSSAKVMTRDGRMLAVAERLGIALDRRH